MLDYCVALVVANLYSCIKNPERKEALDEIHDIDNGGIERFIRMLKQQKYILADAVENGSVNLYSKASRRPISKEQALDLLSKDATDDLIIYGPDLLYGDRHPANFLSDVIRNAQTFLGKHPAQYFSQLTKTSSADNFGKSAAEKSTDTSNKQWVEKALHLANSLALSKYNAGIREITARNICDAVATELSKDSTTHGTRGPRTGGSIRNTALKRWKFNPPTGTSGTK